MRTDKREISGKVEENMSYILKEKKNCIYFVFIGAFWMTSEWKVKIRVDGHI